eukprot:UN23783
MTSSFQNLSKKSKTQYAVQRYIGDVLTINKKKFDFRLYVLIKTLDPLKIYLCREGLVRFCTQPYHAPSPVNISQQKMTAHLTNYGLNKDSENFVRSQLPSGGNGSKRSLQAFLNTLKEKGNNVEKLMIDIETLVRRTIIAILPILKLGRIHLISKIGNDNNSLNKCFHVVGF